MHSVRTRSIRILVLVLCAAYAATGYAQSDPRTQPDSAIKEAIRLLEAKKYAEFIRTFARPSELEELLARQSLEAVSADFEKRKAADVLAMLRAAATMKPALNEDRTRAEYAFEKPVGGERRLQLEKIGQFWYLRD